MFISHPAAFAKNKIKIISEPWRNVGFCSSTCNKNDSNLKEGWYRFTGISGDQVVTSCANAQNNTNGSYNLFTCNSSNRDFTTYSDGFIVYYLRPIKGIYATREKNFKQNNQCLFINLAC